jgi:hypothetical protein
MTALLTIRNELVTALAGRLGTYTLANGSTTPAVRCSDPQETRYPGTFVDGLELVLLRSPAMTVVRQYQEEFAIAEWTAFLVNWDGDDKALEAAKVVANEIPGTDIERQEIPAGIGPQDQYRLTLRSRAAEALDAPTSGTVPTAPIPAVVLDGDFI